jgi:predicted NACHT family NTPase
LLNTWDGDRGIQRKFNSPIYQKLSIEDKQNLLGTIAIQKFQQDQFALFTQREIQKYIADYLKISLKDGQAVLKSIEAQHGLLVERASEIYSFSHLTFQEYFAARWLCDAGNWQSVKSDVTQKRWKEVLSIAFTLPNADRLAQAVKAEIDQMLALDTELQKVLIWLSKKSSSVEAPYRKVAIYAFYFTILLDLAFGQVPSRYRLFSLALDLNLAHPLNLDLALDLSLARASSLTLSRDRDFAIDRSIDGAFARSECCDTELQRKLGELLAQLPDRSAPNQNNFYQWWKVHIKAWGQQLRTIMIEHRNIGHDWQFTEEQKQKLQQYYDANKLLVDCLKQKQCKVSPEVRQAIEDSLLLPVRSEG